ncbi:MAG: hypothetical protein KA100_05440 [Rickettsiales bacterium]|nr:hypothetical protein [Rickettsiales bacterium]
MSLITAFSSNALADHDLQLMGTISSVNKDTKVIVVKNTEDDMVVNVTITPATSVEFENRLIDRAKFADLKEGQYVKVEYLPNASKKIIAQEVKIYSQEQ